MNRRALLLALLQVAVAAGILGWVVLLFGTGPFVAAVRVLTWPGVVGALVLGSIGVLVQAQRWRLIARRHGIELGWRAAAERCWQAAFINSVLPGGLAGDVVRAAEQRPVGAGRRRDMVKRSLGVVAAERERADAAGTPPVPVLCKVAPDMDDAALHAAVGIAQEEGVAGIIATNTTLRRDGLTAEDRA